MFATITLLEGPSVFAPFAAVMVEADCPSGELLTDRADEQLRQFLPPLLRPRVAPLADGRFETVAAAIANALHDCFGANELPSRVERLPNGKCRVLLGFLDPAATAAALRTALDLAGALFAQLAGQLPDAATLGARVDRVVEQMRQRHPDPIARSLLLAARRRGIPVMPVAPGSRAWLLGHGARALQVYEAANHHDSMIGARISRHRFRSNQLVLRLGFPGVRQVLASDPQAALRVAREIGYPVVVKPVAGGKGAGVTANVTDDLTLATAFAEADRISPGDVLVERHVAGEEHRIVVIGGKFAWAERRLPARVVGDGARSIEESMASENRHRAESPSADTARGKTLSDHSADVHPDVRDMAQAIARGFHLDVMGLDFVTPDITRSWREVDCAVVEVNAMPALSSDARAELILDSKFPDGASGRIPSLVLVEAPDFLENVVAMFQDANLRVGCTSSTTTQLAGRPRVPSSPPVTLAARVGALVLDPACESLVICTTSDAIERQGFPVGYCDIALIGVDASIPTAVQRVIGACAHTTLRLAQGFDSQVRGAIAALLEKSAVKG